jgi:hypothetical protein
MIDEVVPMKPTLAVDNKTYADLAAELRSEMQAAIQPVISVLNKAHQQGFEIGLTLQRDQFGRWFVAPLGVSKIL